MLHHIDIQLHRWDCGDDRQLNLHESTVSTDIHLTASLHGLGRRRAGWIRKGPLCPASSALGNPFSTLQLDTCLYFVEISGLAMAMHLRTERETLYSLRSLLRVYP